MFGHRVQHRLKRRIRDDAQHLGGGSLLLRSLDQALLRVGDLPFACFKLSFEIGAGLASSSSTNPRLCLGQVKLATLRSALRPFARQGRLHRPRSPNTDRHSRGDGAWRRIARSPERAPAHWPLWVKRVILAPRRQLPIPRRSGIPSIPGMVQCPIHGGAKRGPRHRKATPLGAAPNRR